MLFPGSALAKECDEKKGKTGFLYWDFGLKVKNMFVVLLLKPYKVMHYFLGIIQMCEMVDILIHKIVIQCDSLSPKNLQM